MKQKALWRESSHILRSIISTSSCHTFYSSISTANAACCLVIVDGEIFGFCTLLKNVLEGSLDSKSPDRPRKHSGRGSVSVRMNYRYGWRTRVSFVDLFRVQCRPPIDFGLCSQYVSTAILFWRSKRKQKLTEFHTVVLLKKKLGKFILQLCVRMLLKTDVQDNSLLYNAMFRKIFLKLTKMKVQTLFENPFYCILTGGLLLLILVLSEVPFGSLYIFHALYPTFCR